jgi:AraC family cel operon transcriptional repressor
MIRVCDYKNDFKKPETGLGFHYFNSNYKDLHTHNYWEIFLITEGRLLQTINNHTMELKKNDCFIIRPKDVHVFNQLNDYTSQHINLMITDKLLQELLDNINPYIYSTLLKYSNYIQLKLSDQEYESLNLLIDQLYHFDKSLPLESIIKIFIIDVVKYAYIDGVIKPKDRATPDEDKPSWIIDLVNKLNSVAYVDQNINTLCQDIPFSQVHINRLFKFYMKKTIGSYFNEVKMKYACRLLETTNFTILDICSRIGYSSLSHFTRAFKEKYKCTPKEFRNLHS